MKLDYALFTILLRSGSMLLELAPYVVGGVVLGQALRYTNMTDWVRRACAGAPAVSVAISAVLGIASPLCTYGTMPVAINLYRSGVALAPLVAFLGASSLMNPQLFLLTWGGVGLELALARVVAVLLFGLLLGLIVHWVPADYLVTPLADARDGEESEHQARRFSWARFVQSSWYSTLFVGYYLVIGILAGATIEVVVPARWILWALAPGHFTSVLIASLLGIPLNACGGGTIPLIAGLLEQGMGQGSALAFFISGPATRITPLMALASLLRTRSLVAYVALVLVFAMAAGWAYGS